MYHGEDESVPYSSQAKHHKVVAKATVEAVLKYLETRIVTLNVPEKFCAVDYGSCDGVLALDVFSKILDGAKYIKDIDCTFILNDQDTKHLSLLGRNISEWELFSRSNISTFLNAGNMYRRCLPPQSVDVVLCNVALHFLDHVPVPCFLPNLLPESNEKKLILRQADTEWTKFLTERCEELKTGGMIVATVPLDNGLPFVPLMANVWSSIFDDGLITEAEYRGPVIPIYLRKPEEILAPFDSGVFKRLRLVSSEEFHSDRLGHCLDSTGRIDMKASARSITDNIKSWSGGYIIRCLQGTEADKQRVVDVYYDRLNTKVLSGSCEYVSFKLMMVVAVRE